MSRSWGDDVRINARFVDLLALYRAELLERVVPFWLNNAIDWNNGGVLTCISDEGRVPDPEETARHYVLRPD